jgi:glyoxylase-like metal-dependent hydrolase (beta-lactamase superfamily II)
MGNRTSFRAAAKRRTPTFAERAGVPVQIFDEMRDVYRDVSLFTDALTDGEFSSLRDESELEFASGTLKVLHTPGHTPGSCSFVREANRTVIAATAF